jgi:hypothetical protein
LLILDVDKKRHDEALESRSKYARNERARGIDRREKRNLYGTSVQFCQTFVCLSILSDILSSDEVFLPFNHNWSYLQLHYLSLIVICIDLTSCKQLISLSPVVLVYTHILFILLYSMSLKYTINIWFRSIFMKKQRERKGKYKYKIRLIYNS